MFCLLGQQVNAFNILGENVFQARILPPIEPAIKWEVKVEAPRLLGPGFHQGCRQPPENITAVLTKRKSWRV